MAHVLKRGRWWHCQIYDPASKRKIRKKLPQDVRSKAQAMKAALEIEVGIRRAALGLSSESSGAFLDVANPIALRVEDQQHRNTVSSWNVLLDRFVERFGNRDVREFRQTDFEDWRDFRLSEKAAPATVGREIQRLGQVFERAVKLGILEKNPCAEVARPKEKGKPPRWMSRSELALFFSRCPRRYRLRYMFLAWTGARMGEALALRWEDVDLVNGRVLLRNTKAPKDSGRDWRVVPLRPLLARLLAKGKARAGQTGEVFQAKNNWRRAFLDVCRGYSEIKDPESGERVKKKRTGIDGIRLHDLRHTFASHMVMSGAPLDVVRDLLGHSTVRMTEKYAHLAPERHRWAIGLLRGARRDESGVRAVSKGREAREAG